MVMEKFPDSTDLYSEVSASSKVNRVYHERGKTLYYFILFFILFYSTVVLTWLLKKNIVYSLQIGAVTRASKIDFDELASNISKLESECKASWDHLKLIAKHDGSTMMKVK